VLFTLSISKSDYCTKNQVVAESEESIEAVNRVRSLGVSLSDKGRNCSRKGSRRSSTRPSQAS